VGAGNKNKSLCLQNLLIVMVVAITINYLRLSIK
jgi:hypothetical protein